MTLPVSRTAQLWLMSNHQVAKNVLHALQLDSSTLPEDRVVTLPAVYSRMGDLVEGISAATHTSADKIQYEPDPLLEAAFGAFPPLTTGNAEKAGFAHDGSLEQLIANTLDGIE